MKTFNSADRNFTRGTIPSELGDLSLWPTVDQTALPEEVLASFCNRVEAIRLFVEHSSVSLADIERKTGVPRQRIEGLFAKCIAESSDGRMWGFRALIPYKFRKGYERRKKASITRSGLGGDSGLFAQLLLRHDVLVEFIDKEIRNRAVPIKSVRQVRIYLIDLHSKFIELCRRLNIKSNEYPFNRDEMGLRSLQQYVKKRLSSSFELAARSEGATYVRPARHGHELQGSRPAIRLLDEVQIDGHRIDLRLSIAIADPFGMETIIEIERVWILVVVDVATRAALGYSLAIARQYSANDVVNAICNALIPQAPRKLTIPMLAYPPGSGFPNYRFPEMAYACWRVLALDRASTHLAQNTLALVTRTVGCWTDAGPVGEPIVRGIVERFFHLLSQHFAHKLPGTTGRSPDDIARVLADPNNNIKWLMRLSELEELIDVVIAEHNCSPTIGLGARTPLEAVDFHLRKLKELNQELRHIPSSKRSDLYLLHNEEVVTVRGSLKGGVRPHINFHGAKYTNSTMEKLPQLIGTELRIRYNENDISSMKAFYMDGAEFGIIIAEHPWGRTPHSLKLRKAILRAQRLGRFKIRPGQNPISAYLEFKQAQATGSRQAATSYAWALKQASASRASQTDAPSEKHSESAEATTQSQQPEVQPAPIVKTLRIKQTFHSR